MRVGIGFDTHTFAKGEKLILGGVQIPYTYGLKGYSDADVLTHALIDAILGALGKGDIGKHFPDTDDKYKDICSLILLERTYTLLKEENYEFNNGDLIVMAQAPKLAKYVENIVSNLCEKLNTETERINFKATTTEGLGFVGRKEGIAVQAIVSLNKIK